MLFLQLIAFSFCLVFFLRLAIRESDGEAVKGLGEAQRKRVRFSVNTITVLSGVLAFWLPFAFGWVG